MCLGSNVNNISCHGAITELHPSENRFARVHLVSTERTKLRRRRSTRYLFRTFSGGECQLPTREAHTVRRVLRLATRLRCGIPPTGGYFSPNRRRTRPAWGVSTMRTKQAVNDQGFGIQVVSERRVAHLTTRAPQPAPAWLTTFQRARVVNRSRLGWGLSTALPTT